MAFPHASSKLGVDVHVSLSVSAKKGLVKDIYRVANRITLHLLGRENQPMEELLRVLTLIMNNQSSILSEANPDRKFFCCLCLDLLPFLLDDNQQIRRTTINVSLNLLFRSFTYTHFWLTGFSSTICLLTLYSCLNC